MKQKFVDAHMAAAEVYSKLSTAKRLQVGCVVVKDNTIIGIGYNGMPSGWTNDCEDVIQLSDDTVELKTKSEVLHAETNALAKIAKSTNSANDILFCFQNINVDSLHFVCSLSPVGLISDTPTHHYDYNF